MPRTRSRWDTGRFGQIARHSCISSCVRDPTALDAPPVVVAGVPFPLVVVADAAFAPGAVVVVVPDALWALATELTAFALEFPVGTPAPPDVSVSGK